MYVDHEKETIAALPILLEISAVEIVLGWYTCIIHVSPPLTNDQIVKGCRVWSLLNGLPRMDLQNSACRCIRLHWMKKIKIIVVVGYGIEAFGIRFKGQCIFIIHILIYIRYWTINKFNCILNKRIWYWCVVYVMFPCIFVTNRVVEHHPSRVVIKHWRISPIIFLWCLSPNTWNSSPIRGPSRVI